MEGKIIRNTKEFSFEMGHLLADYNGLCRNIHGHSYKLSVTIKGRVETSPSPKVGMVMDFSILKSIVNEEIIDRLDHSLMVRKDTPIAEHIGETTERLILTDYQPTCENMVCDIAERIAARLPEGITLTRVSLHETATSYSEWLLEDQ